jgi:hypothetical protein
MMQIPRGTFRDLKKGIRLESLLEGMKEESFSGYCKIVSGKASGLLVFNGGIVILAHSGEFQGDTAFAAIGHWGDAGVDAVLHTLSATQIQLSLEFNPSARVNGGLDGPFRKQSGPHKTARAPPETAKIPEKSRPVPAPSSHDTTEDPRDTMRNRHQESGQRDDDASSLLLQELDTLDAMDLQSIAEKFKENCRQMIEKLELEYLLDSEKPKGSS